MSSAVYRMFTYSDVNVFEFCDICIMPKNIEFTMLLRLYLVKFTWNIKNDVPKMPHEFLQNIPKLPKNQRFCTKNKNAYRRSSMRFLQDEDGRTWTVDPLHVKQVL